MIAAVPAAVTSVLTLWSAPLPADEPGLPRSLAEAIKMERADALPRTAFYDTPSLDATKPGDLLRKAPFRGYAVPSGTRAVRILYQSLNADGRDVATSGVEPGLR